MELCENSDNRDNSVIFSNINENVIIDTTSNENILGVKIPYYKKEENIEKRKYCITASNIIDRIDNTFYVVNTNGYKSIEGLYNREQRYASKSMGFTL